MPAHLLLVLSTSKFAVAKELDNSSFNLFVLFTIDSEGQIYVLGAGHSPILPTEPSTPEYGKAIASVRMHFIIISLYNPNHGTSWGIQTTPNIEIQTQWGQIYVVSQPSEGISPHLWVRVRAIDKVCGLSDALLGVLSPAYYDSKLWRLTCYNGTCFVSALHCWKCNLWRECRRLLHRFNVLWW